MPGTILLVDDSPQAQRLGMRILLELGYQVATVSSGEAALRKLVEFAPDLVITDTTMLGMSGFDLCEKIKADPLNRDLPILLAHVKFEPLDNNRAQKCGANCVINKPFEAAELETTVGQMLATARQAREAAEAEASRSLPPTVVVPTGRRDASWRESANSSLVGFAATTAGQFVSPGVSIESAGSCSPDATSSATNSGLGVTAAEAPLPVAGADTEQRKWEILPLPDDERDDRMDLTDLIQSERRRQREAQHPDAPPASGEAATGSAVTLGISPEFEAYGHESDGESQEEASSSSGLQDSRPELERWGGREDEDKEQPEIRAESNLDRSTSSGDDARIVEFAREAISAYSPAGSNESAPIAAGNTEPITVPADEEAEKTAVFDLKEEIEASVENESEIDPYLLSGDGCRNDGWMQEYRKAAQAELEESEAAEASHSGAESPGKVELRQEINSESGAAPPGWQSSEPNAPSGSTAPMYGGVAVPAQDQVAGAETPSVAEYEIVERFSAEQPKASSGEVTGEVQSEIPESAGGAAPLALEAAASADVELPPASAAGAEAVASDVPPLSHSTAETLGSQPPQESGPVPGVASAEPAGERKRSLLRSVLAPYLSSRLVDEVLADFEKRSAEPDSEDRD
jgi:chemotaxis family two-component system response regulator PixH